ncbi:hypothetical protein ACOMHN_046652 [Nucella lapillus]
MERRALLHCAVLWKEGPCYNVNCAVLWKEGPCYTVQSYGKKGPVTLCSPVERRALLHCGLSSPMERRALSHCGLQSYGKKGPVTVAASEVHSWRWRCCCCPLQSGSCSLLITASTLNFCPRHEGVSLLFVLETF